MIIRDLVILYLKRERQFNFAYTSFISIPHDAKTNNTISIADPKDFQMGGGGQKGEAPG